MKYFVPNWQFTKQGALQIIKGDLFPVVQKGEWGDVLFFDLSAHEPISTACPKEGVWETFSVLIPIEVGELRETFSHAESINGKCVVAKGFHKKLFFEIIKSSADKDSYNGTFYILKCREYYKIGISTNYENRRKTYRTENPFVIDEIFAEKIHCADKVESCLKRMFKHQNHRGEWFNFTRRDLKFIIAALNNITTYGDEELV